MYFQVKDYLDAFTKLGYTPDASKVTQPVADLRLLQSRFLDWLLTDPQYGMLRIAVGEYTDNQILSISDKLKEMADRDIPDEEWRSLIISASDIAWNNSEFNQPKAFCAVMVAHACCPVFSSEAVMNKYMFDGMESMWSSISNTVAKETSKNSLSAAIYYSARALSDPSSNLIGIYAAQYEAFVNVCQQLR